MSIDYAFMKQQTLFNCDGIVVNCCHVASYLASCFIVCYDYRRICFQTNRWAMYLLLPCIINETKSNHTTLNALVRRNGFTVDLINALLRYHLYDVRGTMDSGQCTGARSIASV